MDVKPSLSLITSRFLREFVLSDRLAWHITLYLIITLFNSFILWPPAKKSWVWAPAFWCSRYQKHPDSNIQGRNVHEREHRSIFFCFLFIFLLWGKCQTQHQQTDTDRQIDRQNTDRPVYFFCFKIVSMMMPLPFYFKDINVYRRLFMCKHNSYSGSPTWPFNLKRQRNGTEMLEI